MPCLTGTLPSPHAKVIFTSSIVDIVSCYHEKCNLQMCISVVKTNVASIFVACIVKSVEIEIQHPECKEQIF